MRSAVPVVMALKPSTKPATILKIH
jgi:hypothetical protein